MIATLAALTVIALALIQVSFRLARVLGTIAGLGTFIYVSFVMVGGGVVSEQSAKFTVDDARAAMCAGDYSLARDRFGLAEQHGGDKISCIYGAAECSYRLGDIVTARQLADDLIGMPGGEGLGRRVRGWLAEGSGDEQLAFREFQAGSWAGDPICGKQVVAMLRGGKVK
jgi:hypothetical protein